MSQSPSHPSVAELTAFSVGQLSEDAAASVECHIVECQPCCNTLLELSSNDTFVGLLQDCNEQVNGATLDLPSVSLSNEVGLERELQFALDEQKRYEIIGLLGKGGMGKVFKARHRMMERTVALKVINAKLMYNPEAVERFHREVKTAARLSHPNIVAAYDAEQADGIHFLVMEFVEGVNLAEWVNKDKPLHIAEACEYARQVAVGLQYAHERGMVHRDIKPQNLMRTSNGMIKILDFGLASLGENSIPTGEAEESRQNSLTAFGSIMGTPDFISPEQAADAHQADIRSDIYSLGATLHFLLCGQAPFAHGSVAEKIKSHAETNPQPLALLRSDVTQELSDIVSRMMSKNPDDRFQSPQDVATALAPFSKQGEVKELFENKLVNSTRSPRFPSSMSIALATAALGLTLAGVFYVNTDQGVLVVESIDENVTIQIKKAQNSNNDQGIEMRVVDTVTGSEVVRLPSGKYEISLVGDSNEYKLSKGGFTLARGDNVVVKATRNSTNEASPASQSKLSMTLPAMAQQALLSKGSELTAEAVKELEAKTLADPHDCESRLQLLGFYSSASILSPEFRQKYADLVIWLIANFPESEGAGSTYSHIDASIDPSGYLKAKNLWLKQISVHGEDTSVLSNAAKFFLQSDRKTTEELLKIAQALEPDNIDWCDQLGQLYRLGLIGQVSAKKRKELATNALLQFERSMSLQGESNASSSTLVDLAKASFEAGEIEKAKKYAERALHSETGNAIHSGNIILGRLALKDGKIDEAGKYLIAAGKTSGSPNLGSFGPNMLLAKALLESGQKQVVLEYFELCKNFWDRTTLEKWSEVVKNGGIPDFGPNIYH